MWALDKLQYNFQHKHNNNKQHTSIDRQQSIQQTNNHNSDNNNGNKNTNNKNISVVVPYMQRVSERLKKSCNKKGIQVHFKGSNTIRNLLMAPKDKDSKLQKSGVTYRYKCPTINCPQEYIGETGRALGDMLKEHLRAPCPIHQHTSSTGHPISPDCFSIVHREAHSTTRNIKEAMSIRTNVPSLNRNLGKYHLPHMWDSMFQDTQVPKLK